MKIAMIGQKGIPALYGGVEKHVQELSIRLTNDHEVVAYTRPYYTSKHWSHFQKVRLVSLPTIYSKHFDAIVHTFISIIHAVYREKVDVIHIHAVGPALLTWLPRLLSHHVKVVVTFHCVDRQHQKWNWFAKACLFLGEWMAMKFAHEVIGVSKTLQQYSYEMYRRSIRYIPNGIVPMHIVEANQISDQFGLEKDGYILTVARLVRHKGIHYLIQAYQQLNTTKKLVIVGDSVHTDDYVTELKTLANGNPNIIFTGNQYGNVLAELFSNACLYVLPSESEGLPIALLEAAAYGKATVVSDIPANMEIVHQPEYIFRNTDSNDLKEKLAYLLEHPKLVNQSAQLLRTYVLTNYQWNDIAQATLQLYRQLSQEEYLTIPRVISASAVR
jgi:glycosyltransferase involved in cell wall biosynthesis